MYPALKTVRKSGNEKFKNTDKNIILSDFWSWAYSDLIGNTERGKLAEYIVATAINAENDLTDSFAKYDLVTNNGIKIEVKSSGYIQSWYQTEYSKIVFNIPKTFGWDEKTNSYSTIKERQSDVYVLCVHKHKDQDTLNPLDISQWDFYVLPTKLINTYCENAKTVTLSKALKIGAVKCEYSEIKNCIEELSCI